jgi:hypothetical protein
MIQAYLKTNYSVYNTLKKNLESHTMGNYNLNSMKLVKQYPLLENFILKTFL